MARLLRIVGTLLLWTTSAAVAIAADLGSPLKILQQAAPEGAGSRQAAQAWQQVARADVGQLTVVLSAIDAAGPLGANWIRTAADAVAQRALARDGTLPTADLEQFVLDTTHAPRARRTAYEWLLRVDPSAEHRIIPQMLNDKSLRMRRDAIDRLTEEANELLDKDRADDAAPLYAKALTAARDLDQVRSLTERLRKLGSQVDLPRHFGFLVHWKLIGPFDNTDQKAFDLAYPPEGEIDLAAEYQGKQDAVRWIDYAADDDYGTIDLNKALGEQKGVVGYATTEFFSSQSQQVEFRLTSYNAAKLWLNGRLINRHHIYHAGSQMDQYVSTAELRSGRNVILVKSCQNEQTQDWARYWEFKLRVCDAQGNAVLSTRRPPSQHSPTD